MNNYKYIFAGLYFGLVLIKSEAISWYRIVEMFHFQAFHMYGVIFSAILVGLLSNQIIQFLKLKDSNGQRLKLKEKPKTYKASLIGGLFFGIGWALVGACPGPLFIQLGALNWIIIIPIFTAHLGAIIYGHLQNKLPH